MQDMAGNEIKVGDRVIIHGAWAPDRGVQLWMVGMRGEVTGLGRTRVVVDLTMATGTDRIGNELLLVEHAVDGRELLMPSGKTRVTR